VFDRVLIVCFIGAAAIAISHSGNALFNISQRYELRSNEHFNARLIEAAKRQRAEDATR